MRCKPDGGKLQASSAARGVPGVKLVVKAAGNAADLRKPLAVRPMQVVRKDALGRQFAAEAGQVRRLAKLESNVISAV